MDKIVDEAGTITYEPKPLNEIANNRPNTGDVDMNGKKLTNLNTNVDFSGGIGAIASTATTVLLSSIMHPNTGPQNLTSEASYGNKRATDVLDPVAIL